MTSSPRHKRPVRQPSPRPPPSTAVKNPCARLRLASPQIGAHRVGSSRLPIPSSSGDQSDAGQRVDGPCGQPLRGRPPARQPQDGVQGVRGEWRGWGRRKKGPCAARATRTRRPHTAHGGGARAPPRPRAPAAARLPQTHTLQASVVDSSGLLGDTAYCSCASSAVTAACGGDVRAWIAAGRPVHAPMRWGQTPPCIRAPAPHRPGLELGELGHGGLRRAPCAPHPAATALQATKRSSTSFPSCLRAPGA